MAATRGEVLGGNAGGRVSRASRLGSQYVETSAATWRTFVRVHVNRDGKVYLSVERDGTFIHEYVCDEPEGAE